MVEDRTEPPIVHFVGSIPLPDAETVFRRLAQTTGPYLQRLPGGETGIRKTWIRFLQRVAPAANSRASASPMPWAPAGDDRNHVPKTHDRTVSIPAP